MTRQVLIALFIVVPPLPAQTKCSPPRFDIGTFGTSPSCLVKPYCHTDVLLVPKEKATTVPNWQLREIEVDRIRTGPVLDFVEEKRFVTQMTLKTHEVEKDVVVVESRPVTVTDACTGKCRTEYQPYEVVRKVKVKVSEVVPVQREVVIRVPVLKPGPEAILKRMQLDKTTAPAIERRFDAVVTPKVNEVAIPVPHVVPTCPKPPCR